MRILTIATITVLTLTVSPAAYAHATLDGAEPRVGTTVPAPKEVVLSFTQNIEPAFSSIEVSDAKGTRVDQGKTRVSASTMRIGLKPLSPGSYHVRWHVLSVDTHTTEGSFSFNVGH